MVTRLSESGENRVKRRHDWHPEFPQEGEDMGTYLATKNPVPCCTHSTNTSSTSSTTACTGSSLGQAWHREIRRPVGLDSLGDGVSGFAPPFGGTQRLPRLIGRKRALHMILTGEPISAAKARDIGLVNDVVPHQRLLDEAFALAGKIVAKSPLAVAAGLGSVTRGINVPIDEGLAIEAGYFARMVPTRDIEEGMSAWLAKRRPQFTGT